ncbi:MAG: hypothetical protein WHS46_06815, partial [Desulfosoma sp.]
KTSRSKATSPVERAVTGTYKQLNAGGAGKTFENSRVLVEALSQGFLRRDLLEVQSLFEPVIAGPAPPAASKSLFPGHKSPTQVLTPSP